FNIASTGLWSFLVKHLRAPHLIFLFLLLTIMGVRAASTNGASDVLHFEVDRYDVSGNTLLPKRVIERVFTRHTGTNVTFDDVAAAEKELQMEYHNRGFDTVSVTIPQQRLTNGIFKI